MGHVRLFDFAPPDHRVIAWLEGLCANVNCGEYPYVPIYESKKLRRGWLSPCPACGKRSVLLLSEGEA